MSFKIRDIVPSDIPQTIRVYHETWLATYPNKELGITREDIDKHFAKTESEEVRQKRIERVKNLPPNEKYLVAESEGNIIGLCRVIRHDSYNQLQAIYVLPDYQGKGLGQMLWDEARKFLDQKRNTVVHVATYNSNAIAFYKRNGFTETGKVFNEERHRLPSGILIPETELIRPADNPRHRSAGIVIYKDKVLLMRRENERNGKFWIFPGGGVEDGETPEQAAVRELLEETTVEVRNPKLIYRVLWDLGSINYFYLCEYVSGEPKLRPDSPEVEKMKKGGELYEPIWVDISELANIVAYPLEVRDLLIRDYKEGFKDSVEELTIRFATRRQG